MFAKLFSWLSGKRSGGSSFDYIPMTVPKQSIDNFIVQAKQKIATEGWGKQGRNVDVKIRNFVQCWITEEGFKQFLMKKNKWFRYRGLYFGDAAGAGADFTVKIDGKETTLGLRSLTSDSLQKWKAVAYPDDRFRNEKDNAQKSTISGTSKSVGGIADYHIVCSQEKGKAKFYGVLSKKELLEELSRSKVLYSKSNQEKFRIIPLDKFLLSRLVELVERMD